MSGQISQDTLDGIEEQESSTLRAELKEWERSFAAANGGRKPGRDDIKNNPSISAKYKAYSRLRAQSSQAGFSPAPAPTQETQMRKRKRPSDTQEDVKGAQLCSTPRKSSKHIPATPRRGLTSASLLANTHTHPSQLDPYDSPSTLRKLFSPSYHNSNSNSNSKHQEPVSSSPLPLRAVIGPTPQRDGKALGLFDLLSVSGGSSRRDSAAATPCSRPRRGFNRHGDHNTFQTPSRRRADRSNTDGAGEDGGDEEDESFFARARTPASSAKKFYLANFFATPPAYRYSAVIDGKVDNGNDDDGNQLDSNDTAEDRRGHDGSKKAPGSDTPSFLRRRNLFSSSTTNPRQHARGVSGGDLHDLSPVAVRMPQKLVGRGLSTIVQGLRNIQEERLDEDLDVLREMEAERDNVVISDSQVLHDDDDDDDDDGNGNGLATNNTPANMRQWKKKGQKRTTRRVTMKPVRAKPKPTAEWPVAVMDETGDGDRDGGSEDELTAILETQPQLPLDPGTNKENEQGRGGLSGYGRDKDKDADNGSEPNYASDWDSDANYEDDTAGPASPSHTRTGMKKKIVLSTTNTTNVVKRKQAATKIPTVAAKQKLKTKPDAHANYRALKIRGKGSHARGGGRFGGGRFGRRR